MADETDMDETMREIDHQDQPVVPANKREELQGDIKSLKADIVSAQETMDSVETSDAYTPVSPEHANESKKNIVFLKKDLLKKQTEYDQLDS
jgi:hypothetical protein